jgi:hypothetical protein
VSALPARFDWLDGRALAAGLAALADGSPVAAAETGPAQPAVGRAPSALQAAVEAALTDLVDGPSGVALAAGRRMTGIVTLWAALAAQHPQWADDDRVRRLVESYVDRRLAGHAIADQTASGCPTRHPATPGSVPPPATSGGSERRGDRAARPAPSVAVDCAGLFLLLRTLDGLRLAAASRRAGIAPAALLAALAERWAGPAAEPDELAAMLAAVTPTPPAADDLAELADLAGLAELPGGLTALACQQVETDLLAMLIGQQRLPGDAIRLRRVPFATADLVLVGGDEADAIWPAGEVDTTGGGRERLVARWAQAAGGPPARVQMMPPQLNDSGRDALLAGFAALEHAHRAQAEVDLALDLMAMTVLRAWASWLPGFGAASVPFVLSTFVRRPGRFTLRDGRLRVELAPAPYDVVLRLAGYLEPFTPAPAPSPAARWLGPRHIDVRTAQ